MHDAKTVYLESKGQVRTLLSLMTVFRPICDLVPPSLHDQSSLLLLISTLPCLDGKAASLEMQVFPRPHCQRVPPSSLLHLRKALELMGLDEAIQM